MANNVFSHLASIYVIAEIGVNHNGEVTQAKRLIDKAMEAGADAVKFQSFVAEKLVLKGTPKVEYQKRTSDPEESHFDMLKKLELNFEEQAELSDYCVSKGIEFLSTPYDLDSAKFLLDIGVKYMKTASADLVDHQLQKLIADSGVPAIVSTGMADLTEIKQTVDIYKKAKNPSLVLLHCVSNYPCSEESTNLLSMVTLNQTFSVPVGYSDHSEDELSAIVAVSLGAKVIEKHFTLDNKMEGPDHNASATPEAFKSYVREIRRVETLLGTGKKELQKEEYEMAQVSRKSIVTTRPLNAGHVVTSSDVCLMRPGTGILGNEIDKVIGRRTKINLGKFHKLHWGDLE